MSELVQTPARPRLDLSLYLITDTAMCGGPDGVVETVRRSVAAGVTLVQLRDAQLGEAEFVSLGRRLAAVLAGSGVPLLINDRVELVSAIGAQGAHVGQSDLAVVRARGLLGGDAILGLSAASAAQLACVPVGGIGLIDYVGVGALRSSLTKPEADAVGLEGVKQMVALSPWPVCAIGGVHAADASALAAIGCHGMAVVGAICGQPDVTRATTELAAAWCQAAGRKK